MNEFIGQFILESRDCIEQASSGLLALEQSANDADTLDSVFRAIHTLKGGASIVDFTAMERAVHAAEDVLSRARSGKQPLTRDLIESCLACLDQASRWLNSMEGSGEVPAGADAEASKIIDRIIRATQKDHGAQAPSAVASATWVDSVLNDNQQLRGQAKTALRLKPRSASFFQGEDPLALIASVPGLLWIGVEPIDTWPALDELDPFECILVITSLSGSSTDEVITHLKNHAAECEIVAIKPREATQSYGNLSANAGKLIEAQLALLSDGQNQTLAGRIASAGLVVANVLRHCGQRSSAELVLRASDESLRDKDPQALRQQIAAVLYELPPPGGTIASLLQQEPSVARTVRVDAERVDALVRLTGELTVVKNAIGHAVKLAQADDSSSIGSLKDHHGTLEHLVSELQRAVLAIRVLPLRTVLQRFPRIVREISGAFRSQ